MPKTFRIGVIGRTGHGNYGHGLNTAWSAVSSTQVVAVADDDKSGLAAAAKRLKVSKAFLLREALESSHAVAKAMELAASRNKNDIIVVCLSGRGDKDAHEIARLRGVEIG